jgi:HPt (histidine-containing phosphotransfer) domain-containing protein
MADLSSSFDSAKSQISSIKTFIEISSATKQLKSSAGNSFTQSAPKIASSLENISKQQKRYLRDQKTSFDQILELINLTNGSGLSTTNYLKRKLLEVVVKIEPEIRKIITEESIKALGCSQEQTFTGVTAAVLNQNPLTLTSNGGIYVPIQSLDFASLLKSPVDSKLGKISYEKPNPNAQPGVYKPFSGPVAFPMNKELNLRLENNNNGRSFFKEYGKYYQGTSGADLFDFMYSPTNQYGVTQDCYKVELINRPNNSPNKVIEFLSDYYSTIKLVDSVNIAENLVNVISGAISMKANLSSNEINQSSRFSTIVQRILGLCFDSRREIDVSGVAKVAELDGVDDTFFEFTEQDLRNIDIRISNIQNGVMEFESCDNVKLPVDFETLVDELDKFREVVDSQTPEEQVKSINNILDTIYQNPDWSGFLTGVDVEIAVNKDILKQIPLAVASSVLSPKVLFPIFILLQVVEGQLNPPAGSPPPPTSSTQVDNPTDFLKVFKTFNIQVISKIGALFLSTLYEELKKDILNLISSVISDITKSKVLKKYRIILRLVNILLIVSQLVDDYRKCKSLIDNILSLLQAISQLPTTPIPIPLLLVTDLLPGTSPERSTINTIELLQSVGIPTGPLPDGSANLMGVYNLMTHIGASKEEDENGKVEGVTLTPFGIFKVSGKKV